MERIIESLLATRAEVEDCVVILGLWCEYADCQAECGEVLRELVERLGLWEDD